MSSCVQNGLLISGIIHKEQWNVGLNICVDIISFVPQTKAINKDFNYSGGICRCGIFRMYRFAKLLINGRLGDMVSI